MGEEGKIKKERAKGNSKQNAQKHRAVGWGRGGNTPHRIDLIDPTQKDEMHSLDRHTSAGEHERQKKLNFSIRPSLFLPAINIKNNSQWGRPASRPLAYFAGS